MEAHNPVLKRWELLVSGHMCNASACGVELESKSLLRLGFVFREHGAITGRIDVARLLRKAELRKGMESQYAFKLRRPFHRRFPLVELLKRGGAFL